jgi:hypothetical protein
MRTFLVTLLLLLVVLPAARAQNNTTTTTAPPTTTVAPTPTTLAPQAGDDNRLALGLGISLPIFGVLVCLLVCFCKAASGGPVSAYSDVPSPVPQRARRLKKQSNRRFNFNDDMQL